MLLHPPRCKIYLSKVTVIVFGVQMLNILFALFKNLGELLLALGNAQPKLSECHLKQLFYLNLHYSKSVQEILQLLMF